MRAAHTIGTTGIHLHEGEAGALPWWSFTKLVIAAAALRLVELGALELDAPVSGESYTLRQLLQHEAGLPDYGWLEDYHSAVSSGAAPWAPHEMVSRTLQAQPRLPAGSTWAYSNIGYHYAGQIICQSTGEDLAQSLKMLALAPAGLSRARLAVSKTDLDGVQMGAAGDYDPGWVLHGLLVGPIDEAAKFLHQLLSGAVLGKAMLEQMLNVRLLPQFRSELWPNPAYGLGIMGAFDGAASPCGHSGVGPASTIAVYGLAVGDRVKVAAEWQSPGHLEEAEASVLQALAEL